MPLLFYPSFQTLELADRIFEEIADRTPGFVGRMGASWYWRLAGGILVTFRLDYVVTAERWDIIRAEATTPRVGLFSSADFPFLRYSTSLTSPAYIHDLQGQAEWANRLYFNMGELIIEAAQWLQMLHAAVISPHVAPPASFPTLDDLDRALIDHTLSYLDGRFNLAKLHETFGERISKKRLSQLAQDWENLGLLTSRPRRVTYALKALFEADR